MTANISAAANGARNAAGFSRGTNQIGVRLYNERLILSLIRRLGSVPKAEIARLTGLSAQTVSVIMRQLEADGLVLKRDPQRGRVGQPSVPFQLNPDGAFALGLKIGRRSSDMVLLDFSGAVRREIRLTHPYPTPAAVVAFVRESLPQLTGTLPEERLARVAGLGIATPFELWSWEQEVGAPASVMDQWHGFDTAAEIGAISRWPVSLCNDATAACAAELVLGEGARYADFLYVFIGSFIGGGVVLNGSLYPGRTGNAGAIGSMPIARTPRQWRAGDPATDPQRLALGPGEEAAGGRPRHVAPVALAARLGRFRPGARRLDRRAGGQPRARHRRRDLGRGLRGGDHRRRVPRRDRRPDRRAHAGEPRDGRPPGAVAGDAGPGCGRPRRPRDRRRLPDPARQVRARPGGPAQGQRRARRQAASSRDPADPEVRAARQAGVPLDRHRPEWHARSRHGG